MNFWKRSRRRFLKTTAGLLAAGLSGPSFLRPTSAAADIVYVETPLQTDLSQIDFTRSDRFRIGVIGLRRCRCIGRVRADTPTSFVRR